MTGAGWLEPGLSLGSLPESCIAYSDGMRPYIAVKVAQTSSLNHISLYRSNSRRDSARCAASPAPKAGTRSKVGRPRKTGISKSKKALCASSASP